MPTIKEIGDLIEKVKNKSLSRRKKDSKEDRRSVPRAAMSPFTNGPWPKSYRKGESKKRTELSQKIIDDIHNAGF